MSTTFPTELLPEVAEFLAGGPLGGVVGGRDVASSGGEVLSTVDPGSGRPLATVYAMQPADVDGAVRAAAEAFSSSGWAEMPPNQRGVLLHRLADAVEKKGRTLAQIEALDAGKLLAQAAGDVQNFVATMRYYVELSLHVQRRSPLAVARHEAWTVRHPWGPCGFIFPWNFPILLVGWNISPALAAGNTVVIKPAEDTPLSAIWLARLAREVGFPDGVINVVPGFGPVAGAALAGHPGLRRMSFTGSPEVGRSVAEACGRNLVPVKLELGGKGAAVVFDDAPLDATVRGLVEAITLHTGQVCCNATRWLVNRRVYDRFVAAAAGKLRQVRIGHPLDPASEMGPVVSEKQRRRVLGYLQRGREEGAQVVLEGGPAAVPGWEGFYVKPALLAGSLQNVAAREEIFGPVAFLTPFDDEAQAVRMVNDTDYGLANSVWTADLARASRVAEAMASGNSWINGHNLFPHGVPYAGIHKSGMGGGVLSAETLLDYMRGLSVVRPLG
jgi:aldehyde dehydrogenase (NAD+)